MKNKQKMRTTTKAKYKTHNENNHYYIYGKHPSLMAMKNPRRKIIEVMCTDEFFAHNKNDILKHKYKILETKDLNNITPRESNHQGVIVKTSQLLFSMDAADFSSNNCKIAILDQVTDPHNAGAIIRSAAAFGINYIIMTKDNSVEENGIVAKTSCGGLEIVPIIRVTNLRTAIEQLKKDGFWVLGMDGNTNKTASTKQLQGKVAVILGSEGKGMRRLTIESCDEIVKIPISSDMESLNVSNAAAIIFYEMYKTLGF